MIRSASWSGTVILNRVVRGSLRGKATQQEWGRVQRTHLHCDSRPVDGPHRSTHVPQVTTTSPVHIYLPDRLGKAVQLGSQSLAMILFLWFYGKRKNGFRWTAQGLYHIHQNAYMALTAKWAYKYFYFLLYTGIWIFLYHGNSGRTRLLAVAWIEGVRTYNVFSHSNCGWIVLGIISIAIIMMVIVSTRPLNTQVLVVWDITPHELLPSFSSLSFLLLSLVNKLMYPLNTQDSSLSSLPLS